ncbi:hypothetical protein EYF80_040640 [Liparis tanakae]|uniref:Uncharacterized protein n=1 Tax=Liparis tanakae TaxID=230148 RepID=A0A4Z2G9D7_9TELE|nr:hypothetical protein EYF80_040640 [Liparis tanakae]
MWRWMIPGSGCPLADQVLDGVHVNKWPAEALDVGRRASRAQPVAIRNSRKPSDGAYRRRLAPPGQINAAGRESRPRVNAKRGTEEVETRIFTWLSSAQHAALPPPRFSGGGAEGPNER